MVPGSSGNHWLSIRELKRAGSTPREELLANEASVNEPGVNKPSVNKPSVNAATSATNRIFVLNMTSLSLPTKVTVVR